jgi:hypothetical protein
LPQNQLYSTLAESPFNASDRADVISSQRSEVRQTLTTDDQTHHELSHIENKLSKTQHTNLTESNKSRTSLFKGTVRETRGTGSQANRVFLTARFYKNFSFMEYYNLYFFSEETDVSFILRVENY